GEGFKGIAEEGQRVRKGDVVIVFNLALLEEKAKSILTPVVISNMDEIKELIKLSGTVIVGETPIIRIKK
ncbi:PTS glucose transporter subunit IIA, partial [Vibrio cholerae O1]|nr:PTS glucose transporter subunit IIA [Vibrio cholerae O1]